MGSSRLVTDPGFRHPLKAQSRSEQQKENGTGSLRFIQCLLHARNVQLARVACCKPASAQKVSQEF